MKKSLNREAKLGEEKIINVFDIETKQIVFTGRTREVATYLGATWGTVYSSVQRKLRITSKKDKKKYAVRIAKTES